MAQADPNRFAVFLPLIPNFDGESASECRNFFKTFDQIAKLANWNEEEKIIVLKAKIKGNALQVLLGNPQLFSEECYETLKSKFLEYFAVSQNLAIKQISFENCKQKQGETVKMLANRLSAAAINFLEGANTSNPEVQKVVDKIKLAKFLEALNPELQKETLKANPDTFDNAVKIASNMEMSLSMYNTMSANSMQMAARDNSGLAELINLQAAATNEMVAKLNAEVNNLKLQNAPNQYSANEQQVNEQKHCLFCGKDNHYTNDCFKYKQYQNINFGRTQRQNFAQNAPRYQNQGYSQRQPYQNQSYGHRQNFQNHNQGYSQRQGYSQNYPRYANQFQENDVPNRTQLYRPRMHNIPRNQRNLN